MNRQELAREYLALDQEYDRLDALKTQAFKDREAVAMKLMEVMAEESIDKFRDSELDKSFSIVNDLSITVEDNDAFFAWVRESGNGGAIKENIHHSTRGAIVKDYMMKTGKDVPGTVVKPFKKISMRTAKGVAHVEAN